MKLIDVKSPQDIQPTGGTVLVLGYFDGLHKGHKALFDKAGELAATDNLEVAVLTFYESPQLAFTKFHPDLLNHLTYPQKRANLFASYGVDSLYLTHFTSQFAKQKSKDFVNNYILPFNPAALVVGFDYHFGSDRGDSKTLESLLDVPVHTIPQVSSQDGQKISSTRIRGLIRQGAIREANDLLGYTYSTRGIVVHGDARGRTLGFPTANLSLLDRTFIPADGVYVTDVTVAGKIYRAMTSVGKNVTFDGQDLRIEAHLLDFDGDIYGETVEIFWKDYMRPMEKFDSIENLTKQLKKDREFTINWRKGVEI